MALGWKLLIPVGLVWVLATAALVLVQEDGGLSTNARLGLAAGAVVIGLIGLGSGRGGRDEGPAGPAVSTAVRPVVPVETADPAEVSR